LKTKLQTNFKGIITGFRMQFARSLISTLDSSIAEIAHMVGYEDESNFFRNFKTRYGMSPLQYKKTLTE
jgi:AraC-like DNA-binding protein